MRKTLMAVALSAAMLSQPALLDSFWAFLSSLLADSSLDEGCGADPNGGCNPQPQADEGCGADPDGCPKGS